MSDGSPVQNCGSSPVDHHPSPTKRPREDLDDERSTQEDDQEYRESGTPPPSASETTSDAAPQDLGVAEPEINLVRLPAGPFCPIPGPAKDLPRKGRVVCLDVETTGFTATDSVVEIGAVELIDGVRTGSLFQTYLLPRAPIHPNAKVVHGLDEQFLKEIGALPPRVSVASFVEWVGRSPCVSHNASFDSRMLNQELAAAGYQHSNDAPTTPVFCTMASFRQLHPDLSCSLDSVAQFFNFSNHFKRMTHSALTDAEMCAKCFQRILQEAS